MALDEAVEAIESTLDQADELYKSGAPALSQILIDAEKSIAEKLDLVTKSTGATGKWTEESARATMAQVQLTQKYVDKRLEGLTHGQAKKALAKSVKGTIGLLSTLEQRFSGIAAPLQLQKAGAMHSLINQSAPSLLSRNAASVQRYGAAMIADFERVIRTGLVTGASNHEMIHALISAGAAKGVTAAKLAEGEPKHFPNPTGYMRKRYWAERIIRTETAYAYNRGSFDAIAASRKQFPDMQKKILATFDARTAPDSVAVHGQIRNVEDLFMDGAGRQYLHPPGRPNDRETVVPWRSSWPELSNTAPVDPEQAAAAEVAATPNVGELTADQKKAAMMAAISGKKALLEAKAQAAKQNVDAMALATQQAKAAEAAGKGLTGATAKIDAEVASKAAYAAMAKDAAKKAALTEKLAAATKKAQEYKQQIAKVAEEKAAAEKLAKESAAKAAAAKEAAAKKKAEKKTGKTAQSAGEKVAAFKAKAMAAAAGPIEVATEKELLSLKDLQPWLLNNQSQKYLDAKQKKLDAAKNKLVNAVNLNQAQIWKLEGQIQAYEVSINKLAEQNLLAKSKLKELAEEVKKQVYGEPVAKRPPEKYPAPAPASEKEEWLKIAEQNLAKLKEKTAATTVPAPAPAPAKMSAKGVIHDPDEWLSFHENALKDGTVNHVEAASGYVNLYAQNGELLSYYKSVGGKYVVSPPSSVGMKEQSFSSKEEAAAAALKVSHAIQKGMDPSSLAKAKTKAEAAIESNQKALAAKAQEIANQKAQAAAEAAAKKLLDEKLKDVPAFARKAVSKNPPEKSLVLAAQASSLRVHKPDKSFKEWSPKHKGVGLRPVDLTTKPEKELETKEAKAAMRKRGGYSIAADAGHIEGMDINITEATVDGKPRTFVRFKLTAGAGDLASAEQGWQKKDKFHFLATDLSTSEAKLTTSRTQEVLGGNADALEKRLPNGAKLTLIRTGDQTGRTLHSFHNFVEIEIDGPADPKKLQEAVSKLVPGGLAKPKAEDLDAMRMARALNYTSENGRRTLHEAALEKKAPLTSKEIKAIFDLYADPDTVKIAETAKLVRNGDGGLTLHSDHLVEMWQRQGVKWVRQGMSPELHRLEQILGVDSAGLLSSNERYKRGLFLAGGSTSADIRTGGADGVFARLKTTDPKKKDKESESMSGGTSAWIIEIDPAVLGRLDAYVFNGDNYGAAGVTAERDNINEIAHITTNRTVSGSNEVVSKKAIPPEFFRRVRIQSGSRSQVIEAMRKKGLTEINGVPLEEFFTE